MRYRDICQTSISTSMLAPPSNHFAGNVTDDAPSTRVVAQRSEENLCPDRLPPECIRRARTVEEVFVQIRFDLRGPDSFKIVTEGSPHEERNANRVVRIPDLLVQPP